MMGNTTNTKKRKKAIGLTEEERLQQIRETLDATFGKNTISSLEEELAVGDQEVISTGS